MTQPDFSSLRRIPPPPEGEEPMMLVRRHAAVLAGPVFLFAGAFAASIAVSNDLKHSEWVPFCWAAAGLLLIRLCWRMNWWFTEYYMVTSQRIIHFFGTLRRRSESIPLARVTDISSRQSLPGRLLGYSHLTFESVCADRFVWRFDYAPYAGQLVRELRESAFPDEYPLAAWFRFQSGRWSS